MEKYNSYCRWKGGGYNMTMGGEGTFGWIPYDETRKKMSKAAKKVWARRKENA